MKSRRFIHFIIIFFCLLAILITILSVISFEPPGLIKTLEKNISQNINRNIRIGKLRINLLGKIYSEDLYVGERGLGENESYFLKIKKASASLSIPDIIFGKIKINDVALSNAEISLKLDKNNAWNFSDLIKKGPEKGAKNNFELSNIAIENSSLRFEDKKITKDGFLIALENIDVRCHGIIPSYPSNINFSATLKADPPTHIKLSSNTRLFSNPPALNASLSLDRFSLASIKPYLPGGDNINISDAKASASYDGSRLSISDISFRIGEGGVFGSSELTIKDNGIRHSEKINISGVALESIIPKNSGLQNNISGGLFAELKSEGGDTPDSIKGTVNISIKNGRVKALPIQNTISSILGIPDIEDIYFDNISGDFFIDNGKVSTQNFRLTSKQVNISAKGYFNLNSSISYDVTISLPPELAQRVNLGRFGSVFKDDAGNINIDLKITGTFTNPNVDWLSGQIENVIEKGIGELLKGVLKGKNANGN